MASSAIDKIAVIGIGAMGGGMARALLDAKVCKVVVGYDQSEALVEAFYEESIQANQAAPEKPTSLQQAVQGAKICFVVLQNEPQCQQVCFGSSEDQSSSSLSLLQLLPPGSCVVVSSTVTASWMQKAAAQFAARNVFFVDGPLSGGPARARSGTMTMMISGSEESLAVARPCIDILADPEKIYEIAGGAGQASQVKMAHQLVAGVHICVAAEALCLAQKAGLDVRQFYDLVCGAAGASWMFQDRAPRMITNDAESEEEIIKSQLQIFVKDLDIVHQEARKLQSPIPLASVALQQFIAGQGLGLSRKDDSQVVQVYERLGGMKVSSQDAPSSSSLSKQSSPPQAQASQPSPPKKVGTAVGDYWHMPDGTWHEIFEVGSEPRHAVVLHNEYCRALRVSFPPQDTTLVHRHAADSLYFFLVPGGLDIVNHVQGAAASCADCVGFGEVRFGAHASEQPLVHRITNHHPTKTMLCIDAELLRRPPVTAAIPLVTEHVELIKTRDQCRVYKLTLQPGETAQVVYPFFHLTVVVEPTSQLQHNQSPRWIETDTPRGALKWNEPGASVNKTNIGDTVYVEYIAEWR